MWKDTGHWYLFFWNWYHVASWVSFGPCALTFLGLFGTLLGPGSMHLQKAEAGGHLLIVKCATLGT